MIVCFVDICGFTALAEAHGDLDAGRIVDDLESMVDEVIARTEVTKVKAIGDAFLMTSECALSVIEAATAIVEESQNRDAFPALHIGIHAGDVLHRGDDVLGRTVNVAARVADAAGPDEILLTDAVRELASDGSLRLIRAGRRRLKNVGFRVGLWRAPTSSDARAIDPVCRMRVNEEVALEARTCQRTYHFCSETCRDRFLRSPKSYKTTKVGFTGFLKEVPS